MVPTTTCLRVHATDHPPQLRFLSPNMAALTGPAIGARNSCPDKSESTACLVPARHETINFYSHHTIETTVSQPSLRPVPFICQRWRHCLKMKRLQVIYSTAKTNEQLQPKNKVKELTKKVYKKREKTTGGEKSPRNGRLFSTTMTLFQQQY